MLVYCNYCEEEVELTVYPFEDYRIGFCPLCGEMVVCQRRMGK